jgi:hypothetical protein
MIDPSELADRLPARPLTPAEVGDICDRLEWSAHRIVYQTATGTDYCPLFYAFESTEAAEGPEADPVGDAYALSMDDEMTVWTGEIEATGVAQSTWLAVCETAGDEMGADKELESITVEGESGDITRDLANRHPDSAGQSE